MNGDSITTIHRKEIKEIEDTGGWLLVYGRRKVGKTFLFRNFIDNDVFYLVRRDGSVLSERGEVKEYMDPDEMIKRIGSDLPDGKTMVIDEFQRLPRSTWDEISLLHPNGRLILSGSSFKLVDMVLSERSPLLGLFYPVEIPLISPGDILKGLAEVMKIEDAFKLAPYMRDPWTIPMLETVEDISRIIPSLKFIVPSLIGEVFSEEERDLSRTYESIIALIGAGEIDLDRMSKKLFDRGIISKPSTTHIIPYTKNMEKMGLLRSYRTYKSRKRHYRLASHVMTLYYYLESRYDLDERNVSLDEIEPTMKKMNNLAIEELLADLMGEIEGGRVEILKRKDLEVDILITKRNKPILIGEVKWGKCGKKDLESFRMKVKGFNCRKVLITKMNLQDNEIEILKPKDIMKMIKE